MNLKDHNHLLSFICLSNLKFVASRNQLLFHLKYSLCYPLDSAVRGGRTTRPPPPSCAPGSDIMLHLIYVCNQCVIHSSHLYPSLLGNFTGSRWGVNYGEKKGWPIIHVTMETESRRSGVLYTGITWLLCTVQHKKCYLKWVPSYFCYSAK